MEPYEPKTPTNAPDMEEQEFPTEEVPFAEEREDVPLYGGTEIPEEGPQQGKNRKKQGILLGVGALGAVALLLVGGLIGYNRKVDDLVLEEAKSTDTQLQQLQADLEELQQELSENQTLLDEAKEYQTNRSELDWELQNTQQELNSLESQIANLEGQIQDKQEQLDLLTADVNQAAGEPTTLPAGEYLVGKHLAAGRYRITGSSNFVVYDSNGEMKVNIILGSTSGITEYLMDLSQGMKVIIHNTDTFTPIVD